MHNLNFRTIDGRTGPSRPFIPIQDTFNNPGLIGIITQVALRGGVGYFTSSIISTLNPVFGASLTTTNWISGVIGFLVNDKITGDTIDPWAIGAIIKLALIAIQGFVCSYVFSMSIATFATYYLVIEITNAVISATIGLLQNTIDPHFLPQ